METPARSGRGLTGREPLLLLWAAAVVLLSQAATGFLRGDALHYAAVMKQLAASDDWMTIRFGDDPYFNKPPLFFWYGAAVFRALGASPWTARLVGSLPTVALVLGTYAVARRWFDRRTAFVAGLAVVSSRLIGRYGGIPRLDTTLTLCWLGSAAALLASERDRRWRPLFWLGVGLATAVKGPAGLLPVPIAALASVLARRAAPWNDRRFWLGLPLAVLPVLPWVLHNLATFGDDFVRAYVLDDLLATADGTTGAARPQDKYLADFLTEWWIWVPFVLHGIWLAIRRLSAGDRDGPWALCLAWIAVVLASLLSIGSAYTRYLLPLVPATAILAAASVADLVPRATGAVLDRVVAAICAAGTAIAAFGPFDLHSKAEPDGVRFAVRLLERGAAEPVVFAGDQVPKRMRADLFFHADLQARAVTPAMLADAVASGTAPPLVIAPRDRTAWPADLGATVVLAGDDFDLVSLGRPAEVQAR